MLEGAPWSDPSTLPAPTMNPHTEASAKYATRIFRPELCRVAS